MVVLLSLIFNSQAIALTQDSQKILNNYHNYEQSGSPPATSQPYSPNDSPPEVNVVPTPKTVISPTTTQPYYSPTSQPQSRNISQSNYGAGWIVGAIIVIIIIIAIVKSLSKPKHENYSQKKYTATRLDIT